MSDSLVKLSRLQAQVYFTAKRHGPLTPKHIGLHCGFRIEEASAKVTRPLRKLIKLGLIEEFERKNKRVVQYAAIHVVDPPFLLTVYEEEE